MDRTEPIKRTIRLAAVGDLLLCPSPSGIPYPRDSTLVSPEILSLLAECDIRFGNLEFTLPGDGQRVPTEPRVIGSPEMVRAIAAAGFNVVTLANNHAFDCMEGGFQKVRGLLDELGLRHFGAGMNLDEAAAPAIVECNGVRVAFIAAVDQRSGPYRFAAADQWGVAPLDVDRLARAIQDLRTQVNHVIVSIHWGEERFRIPSPVQVEQARLLVDAGASMVLGHHPHVLQGLELYHGVPIIYSLGNFLADDVHFSDGDVMRWSRTERTGCILTVELSRTGVANIRQVPTYDSGRTVELDETGFGSRRIEKTSRSIARGVTLRQYRREHLWEKTIKPILVHLRWSELKKLRPRHVAKAIHLFCQSGHVK